jgi:hypothetical protein
LIFVMLKHFTIFAINAKEIHFMKFLEELKINLKINNAFNPI